MTTSEILSGTLLPIGAYVLGSVPVGVLIGRIFYRTDIRQTGSGNIGAANALRSLGKTGGAAVLILDALKGFTPTILATYVPDHFFLTTTAAGAVLGHCFSPWLHFRGGKGVATLLGALLALCWQVALMSILLWIVAARITRYSSVASMLACASTPITLWLFTQNEAFTVFGIASALFILWTHRENVQRLREGRENRLGASKAAPT